MTDPRPPVSVEKRRTFVPPGVRMLRHYRRIDLRPDLVAAATVTALLIPSGLAYGEVAGVTPVAGLYTGIFGMAVYALLGSSRTLSVGPESQMAILVAAALLPFAASGAEYAALAAALALITAGVLLAAWVLRLGFIADYLSQPVLVGYLTGVALIIAVNQVAKLVGASTSGDTLLAQVTGLWEARADVDLPSTLVGIGSLLIILGLRRLSPRVPGSLVAVVAMTAISAMIGLSDRGVSVVGEVPRGLPAPQWPSIGLDAVGPLLGPAAGVALIVFANSVLTGRAYAERSKSDPIDANTELLALSGANAASGLFQGFAIGASDSRTAVAFTTGGRTQVVSLLAAGFTGLFLVALAPLVFDLPSPTLAAVVVVAATGIVRPRDWAALYRFRRFEVTLGLVTLIGVAVLGILPGILLAVFVNMVELVATLSRPQVVALGPAPGSTRWRAVSPRRAAELVPDVLAVRYDGPLFFAGAEYLVTRVNALVGPRMPQLTALVLNLEAVSHVDLNGAAALRRLVDRTQARGVQVAFARVRRDVERALYRGGVFEVADESLVFSRVEDAVDALSTVGVTAPAAGAETTEQGEADAREKPTGDPGGDDLSES
ncbi:MAG: SulP family inorganic anion transporter [Jiangellales bacterium]